MRNLIAVPVISLEVILQSAIVSRVTLLSGIADLPMVMLAAWAMQDDVDTAWHWAIATGILVGFVSGLSWLVPVLGFLVVVALAQILQRRGWQAPLLAIFSVTFLGTISLSIFSFVAFGFSCIPFWVADVFCLLTLPRILRHLL